MGTMLQTLGLYDGYMGQFFWLCGSFAPPSLYLTFEISNKVLGNWGTGSIHFLLHMDGNLQRRDLFKVLVSYISKLSVAMSEWTRGGTWGKTCEQGSMVSKSTLFFVWF